MKDKISQGKKPEPPPEELNLKSNISDEQEWEDKRVSQSSAKVNLIPQSLNSAAMPPNRSNVPAVSEFLQQEQSHVDGRLSYVPDASIRASEP